VAQPAIATEHPDPTLIARAQRFEPDAVASLCDRNLGALYRMCEALSGSPLAAEEVTAAALLKALDGLPGFDGDGAAFDVWVLRLGAVQAAKRRPQAAGGPDDVRGGLVHLSNFDYELLALRVLADVDVDHLAPALNAQPASLRAWLVTALREVDGRSGTGWGHDLRGLDAAIDSVIAGTSPETAAEPVSAPADAPRLLRTAAGLRALVGDPIPAETATRLRTSLLAAAAERRAKWVYRHHAVATVPGIERRRYSSRTGTFVALSVVIVLAVVVGTVLAVFSAFSEPDSSLYALKRAGEAGLLTVSLSPVDRAQLEVKLAQTRQREAEDMASRGEGDYAARALGDRYTLLKNAATDLNGVSLHDARWRAARDRLFTESDVSETSIVHNLQVTNQARSVADVEQLVNAYAEDRKPLEAALGRQPGQSATQAPGPLATPTP
jgi:hypothetical protein